MSASSGGGPNGVDRPSAEVLAHLLQRIAGTSDNPDDANGQVLGKLLSATRRPGADVGGAAELTLLRQFPDDIRMAQAAADSILNRARVDGGFAVAFDRWCSEERVRELITELSSAADGKRGFQAWRLRVARLSKRPMTWIATAVLAGAAAAISAAVASGINHGATTVGKALGLPGVAATAIASNPSSEVGTQIGAGVDQGIGCDGNGAVYPSSVTPGLTTAIKPGSGPEHNGKTWDESPAAFGAVGASPAQLSIYVTGPTNHAIVITGLTFHVVSRRSPVHGPWLNAADQCGGGGTYRYGAVDLNSPPPYWVPAAELPKDVRADAIKFPYTATANSPEELLVDVKMENCDCTWYAVLTWMDDGTSKSKRIDNHGRPFETTSVAGVRKTLWCTGGTGGIWSKHCY